MSEQDRAKMKVVAVPLYRLCSFTGQMKRTMAGFALLGG